MSNVNFPWYLNIPSEVANIFSIIEHSHESLSRDPHNSVTVIFYQKEHSWAVKTHSELILFNIELETILHLVCGSFL